MCMKNQCICKKGPYFELRVIPSPLLLPSSFFRGFSCEAKETGSQAVLRESIPRERGLSNKSTNYQHIHTRTQSGRVSGRIIAGKKKSSKNSPLTGALNGLVSSTVTSCIFPLNRYLTLNFFFSPIHGSCQSQISSKHP